DGRTPYRIAAAAGRSDLTKLLRRHGAIEDATPAELFVSACVQGERVEAERQLRAGPALLARLDLDERTAIVRTAEAGNVRAVALMLDLGFPLETRGNNGATARHAAAYSGSPDTVQLLIDRGADIEAHDSTWDSTPLDCAAVGSGERPTSAPDPDWLRTVSILLESGASTSEITLAPDDPKPPSPEVAALLQAQIDPEAK